MGLFKKDYLGSDGIKKLIRDLERYKHHTTEWFWEGGDKEKSLAQLEQDDLSIIQKVRELHETRKDIPKFSSKILNLASHLLRDIETLKRTHDEKKIRFETHRVEEIISEIKRVFDREVELETKFVKDLTRYVLKRTDECDIWGHGTYINAAKNIVVNGLTIGASGAYTLTEVAFHLSNNIKDLLIELFRWPHRMAVAIVVIGLNKRELQALGVRNPLATTFFPKKIIHLSLLIGYVDIENKEFFPNKRFKPHNQTRYLQKRIPRGPPMQGIPNKPPHIPTPPKGTSTSNEDVW